MDAFILDAEAIRLVITAEVIRTYPGTLEVWSSNRILMVYGVFPDSIAKRLLLGLQDKGKQGTHSKPAYVRIESNPGYRDFFGVERAREQRWFRFSNSDELDGQRYVLSADERDRWLEQVESWLRVLEGKA